VRRRDRDKSRGANTYRLVGPGSSSDSNGISDNSKGVALGKLGFLSRNIINSLQIRQNLIPEHFHNRKFKTH
jgi:hypothetical protein